MKRPLGPFGRTLLLGATGSSFILIAMSVPALAAGDAARGEAVFDAAGCTSCHTDFENEGAALAGGAPLETPFGTFHPPNITPDPDHGIGEWSEDDFVRSLRDGVAPDGTPFYPAFPYTSYAGMTDHDMRDLFAYLRTVPPSDAPSPDHDLGFPYSWRSLLWPWRWLHFEPVPFAPDPDRDAAWNRGAYLVRVLGHCGECHTPRDTLGATDPDRFLAGTSEGPEGGTVPNITPDEDTGIGDWTAADIVFALRTGVLPDGDVVGDSMADVVEHSTSKLPDSDLEAIATYLMALPPVANRPGED